MANCWIIAAILFVTVTYNFAKDDSNVIDSGEMDNETDCNGHGSMDNGTCTCDDGYTGVDCQIDCRFGLNGSCTFTRENCTVNSNSSILCQCRNGQKAMCLFDRCPKQQDGAFCNGQGYCYNRGSVTNDIMRCLCKAEYGALTCNELASSTTSSTQQTTITEAIQQITPTEATTYSPPEVTEPDPASPTHGPYAGGTKVVIYGLKINEIDLYLHENVTILEQESNDTALAILTPSYNNTSNATSKSLPFSYSEKGQPDEKTNTSFGFTYMPNPTVSDIFPKKAIKSGGTSVTVTGADFHSVASPKFKVYIRKRTNDENDNATLISLLNTTCKHKDETQLLCRFPNITSELEKLRSRRKRFVGKANDLLLRKIREAPTIDQLQFTLGLEFDGADYYEDLADSNPRLGFIDVHPDPTFQSDQAILFDPAVAKVIGIKGEDIDLGTVVEDYKVYIGDAMCTDIGLTYDKLYCSPPENIDDIKDRGSERKPNEANVTVHIGINLRHYVGFITYNTEDPTVPLYTLFIPVVAAIGGVLLILFIILIVCACRKSDAKDEPLTAPSVTDIDNMAPTGNDNYYTGQTAPKDQYYMVVNKDDKRKESLPPPDKNAVDGRI